MAQVEALTRGDAYAASLTAHSSGSGSDSMPLAMGRAASCSSPSAAAAGLQACESPYAPAPMQATPMQCMFEARMRSAMLLGAAASAMDGCGSSGCDLAAPAPTATATACSSGCGSECEKEREESDVDELPAK